ncbi:hypothetical protein Rhe02_52450 [Rhizocola hellebori]|uniref:Tetratricopeptide repeat protein n=1 Tax=Rhizocola hellebori TaxID=1392758 RepID=A0A8J3QCH8_9ACTN|nr:hypothetical protein [Rhizocola hellebori]GIH07178.1 hypothetical protein Rhe02_52450 [Rhizocola hellebori]
MTTADEVHELIHRSWNTPDGAGRIVLAEQALVRAESLGNPDLEFSARLAATSAYYQGGEPSKAIMTFARNLADYDADPGRRSAEDERLLLWQFKFAISAMSRFPEIPLDKTVAVLNDMERRYRAGGQSLQAVYAYRHSVAAHLGDTRTVDHWYRMWDTAPRDRNSDCRGCDPTSKAHHHLRFGSAEDAIAVAEAALSGQLTCAEQPQSILTALLTAYLRTGKLEQARNAHRRAYRALCDNVANLGQIADHIEFCGLSGNEMRGLELIERHLPWLEKAPTPQAEMFFAAASAQVLSRLAAQGHEALEVRRSEGGSTVAELAASLRERALSIADRFDRRNGNSYQGSIIAGMLDAQPLVDNLPLSVTAARQAGIILPSPFPVPARASAAEDLSAVPVAMSLDEQLTAAEAWGMELDPRADALTARLWQQFGDSPQTTLQQARLSRLRGSADRTRDEASVELFDSAATLFAEAGDRLLELTSRSQRAVAAIYATRSTEPAQEGLDFSEQLLAAGPSPAQRVGVHVRKALLLAMLERPDEALACLESAESEPVPLSPRRRAQILSLRSGLLHGLGRIEEAVAALHATADILRPLGPSDQLASTLFALAQEYGQRRENKATIAAFEEAAAVALDPELKRSARVNAGFMLVSTERAGEFVDDIVEHICLAVAAGDPKAANYTRHRLALALSTVGRYHEAAEVAEEALAWFAEQEEQDSDLILELRNLLAGLYAEIDEPHVAIAQLEILAELTREGDVYLHADVLDRLAELLSRVDRDAEAAERMQTAAQLYGQEDLTMPMLRARRRHAMMLHHAGRHDESRQAVEDLSTLLGMVEVPEEHQANLIWERGMARYDAAMILANREIPDYESALRHLTPAPALFRSIQAFGEALACESRHGQVLVVASRPAEAEAVLNRVLDQLPADHPALRENASWLARALDEQGEKRKARKVRKKYHLPED